MSIYNTETNYPTSIDDLLFISDVDCKSEEIMKQHQNYLQNGEYTNASIFLNEQDDITPITADLFNLIENRIIALQSYLLEQDSVVRAYYEKPENPNEDTIWIE